MSFVNRYREMTSPSTFLFSVTLSSYPCFRYRTFIFIMVFSRKVFLFTDRCSDMWSFISFTGNFINVLGQYSYFIYRSP